MIEIYDRKIIELQRNIFTIKVITAVSRFFVDEEKYSDLQERLTYINNMFDSLEKYRTLFETTSNVEYKNYFENNFHSCAETVEEQKNILYPLFGLSSLVFLDNVKTNIRDQFCDEVNKIISQFKDKNDVSAYICYHGSKDLNEIINYVLNYDIPLNLRSLFEQVKAEKIITYKHKEWNTLGAKLHTALQDIKMKGKQDLFVDEYIYKLSAYRFLLTVFAYDI